MRVSVTGFRVVIPAAGRVRTPVDVDRLTSDVAGHIGGEKDCGACHFVDVACASHRHGEAESLLGAGRRDLLDAFRQGDIGRQRVDPDAVRGELERRGLGVVDDAGLGRRVGRVTGRGAHPLDRGDTDDAARQSLLDEGPRHPLRAQVNVAQVRLVQCVPTVLGGIEDSRPEDSAGVVDQDRHRPEFGGRLLQCRVHRGAVADVDGQPQRADLLGGRGTRVGVAFPDRDPCAEGLQPRRDAAADARAPAGDHRDTVGQKNAGGVECHAAEYRTMPRQGLQSLLIMFDL